MKRPACKLILSACLTAVLIANAHFQVLLPSADLVSRPGPIDLSLIFTHPMENGPVMHMDEVAQFGVIVHGQKQELKKTLKTKKIQGKNSYETSYKIKSPGDHVFFVEPAPYWEPAEHKMIIHYTKVVVSAMGEGEGWDAEVGFPVEIAPLVRPYGLWTGNAFRGIVKKNGKPVPFAEIEVEYLNDKDEVAIPDDAFVTQVIKADANGVFSYAMPRAGWWAFAALVDGDKKMKNPDGKEVDVELGGLIWVRTTDMKEK